MVKKINTEEFQNLQKKGVQIFDFNATWCGPCKMLAPILEELSEELEGKAEFYAIDTDDNPILAREFKIASIPAVVLLKDGEKVDMSVGFSPKPQMEEWIEQYL